MAPDLIRYRRLIVPIAFSDMINSSLVPIKPFPVPPVAPGPTLELAEFPSPRVEDAQPHVSYVNHLYVYPRSLKYDAQKSFHRARNLSCVVELRDSDAKNAAPLKVHFKIWRTFVFRFFFKITSPVCSAFTGR